MKELTEECLSIIHPRPVISHKGNFGRVLLIGGNQQYGGAIIMAAEACVRSGAGLVTVITDKVNHTALHARIPEVMVIDWENLDLIHGIFQAADICLIGPGLGLNPEQQHLFRLILSEQKKEQWFVIDGSALTLLAKDKFFLKYPQKIVLTPHQMEWQRLSGFTVEQQTQTNNQHFQQLLQTIVVLKSHHTEIYSNQNIVRNPLGNPAMATGGTGDILAGIISGFLAQFPRNEKTVHAAVYLHSLIGDTLAKEKYVVLPTEISQQLPFWMKRFENQHTV